MYIVETNRHDDLLFVRIRSVEKSWRNDVLTLDNIDDMLEIASQLRIAAKRLKSSKVIIADSSDRL